MDPNIRSSQIITYRSRQENDPYHQAQEEKHLGEKTKETDTNNKQSSSSPVSLLNSTPSI